MKKTMNMFMSIIVSVLTFGATMTHAAPITETWTGVINYIYGPEASAIFSEGDEVSWTVSYDNESTVMHWYNGDGTIYQKFEITEDTLEEFEYISDATFVFDDNLSSLMTNATNSVDEYWMTRLKGRDSQTGIMDYRSEGTWFYYEEEHYGMELGYNYGPLDAPLQSSNLLRMNHIAINGVAVEPVPEPATMLLFGTGLAGLAGYRRRKAMKK